jgi:hypothetical protein
VHLQRVDLRGLDPAYRPRSIQMARFNRVVIAGVALAGLTILLRGDDAGLYVLPFGILAAVGASAWVLLIEINR